MSLAVVRSIDTPRRVVTQHDIEDFEQELVDQYLLAGVGAGFADSTLKGERFALFEFIHFLGRPVWTAEATDVDRYLAWLRRERALGRQTIQQRAGSVARFFDFLMVRYQGDIHALTGCVVTQPVDEFNRPAKADYGTLRVPPPSADVAALFGQWRESLPDTRKYLPAARDYFAASLWRRVGLRIGETVLLDIRDWRPDLGEFGKIDVRFGKGSRGRGPKTRLVPAIDKVDALMDWWLAEVRPQFGDDWEDPDAPLLPSERRAGGSRRCARIGDDALRAGLAAAVSVWLPTWEARLTPHTLRHHCASSLYERGLDLKAIQELLGHSWLATTTRYIHVSSEHLEQKWNAANERAAARIIGVRE